MAKKIGFIAAKLFLLLSIIYLDVSVLFAETVTVLGEGRIETSSVVGSLGETISVEQAGKDFYQFTSMLPFAQSAPDSFITSNDGASFYGAKLLSNVNTCGWIISTKLNWYRRKSELSLSGSIFL